MNLVLPTPSGKLPTMKTPSAHRWVWWVALLVIVAAAATVRWRLLDVPLERDEGEYAYAGQLMLEGVPPYREAYNLKLPGIYAAYAVVLAVFGQTHRGIHLGLLMINAATIVALFFLGRRVLDALAGIVAAATFALLSVGQPVQGVFANAEHFVLLPAVAGLLLLLRATDLEKVWSLVLGGLLLGLAFLMKQHGAVFGMLGGVYLVIHRVRRRPIDWRRTASWCALFAVAVGLPYLATCGLLWIAGVFDTFWFWTVSYALAYVSQMPLEQVWTNLVIGVSGLVEGGTLIWVLAGVGLSAVVWNTHARKRWLFISLFTVFSLLAVCPGFFFRKHYFVLALPAAALLVGVAASAVARCVSTTRTRVLRYGIAIGLAGSALAVSATQQRSFLFRQTPAQVARTTYGLNPFPESLEIARFIKANTTAADRIAVLGSEPQIFFYSGRRSATGHIYTYGLMHRHDFALRMQEEMIREIEAANPAMLVFVNVPASWLWQPASHKLIFEWFRQYSRDFEPVAVVELRPTGTRYYQGADLASLNHVPQLSVELYLRRK